MRDAKILQVFSTAANYFSIAPLKKAPDAIELVTDGLSIEEVIAEIVRLYRENKAN